MGILVQRLQDLATKVHTALLAKEDAILPGSPSQFWRGDKTWASPSGGSGTVLNKIAGYTEVAMAGDILALCTLTAGFTVVLPTAVGNGARLSFKKMLAAGAIVIDGAGTETIDGGLTATLNNQFESISLISNGANWVIV